MIYFVTSVSRALRESTYTLLFAASYFTSMFNVGTQSNHHCKVWSFTPLSSFALTIPLRAECLPFLFCRRSKIEGMESSVKAILTEEKVQFFLLFCFPGRRVSVPLG